VTRAVAHRGTEQQRLTAVLDELTANRVAHWFDLRGSTGVSEDRFHDYTRTGVDRWVGEHVGSVDTGGAHWDTDGVLRGGRYGDGGRPVRELWWSFNHELPELAQLLVRVFTAHGFDAAWSGDPADSVIVNLEATR
jgi:hypothetical protein